MSEEPRVLSGQEQIDFLTAELQVQKDAVEIFQKRAQQENLKAVNVELENMRLKRELAKKDEYLDLLRQENLSLKEAAAKGTE